MALTLRLSDEQATALQAKAAAEGLSLEEWIQKLTEQEPPAASQPRRHIWDVIAENVQDVPAEDFDALPRDGLSQIDHYVYAVPKTRP